MAKDSTNQQFETVPKRTFIQRFLTFRNIVIFLIVAFAFLTYLSKSYPYFFFDLIITKNIQLINILWFDTLMRSITFLGNYQPGIISLGLTVSLFLILRKYKEALFILISTIGVGIVSETLKAFVARPRPDPELIVQVGKFIRSDSFPSGHVLFYIGFYGFLLFLTYSKLKKSLLRTILTLVLSLLIVLGGLSRIYLGAHWFSDVLGAYLIGSIWIFVVILLYRKLLNASGK